MFSCIECGKKLNCSNLSGYCGKHRRLDPKYLEKEKARRKKYVKTAAGKESRKRAEKNWKHSWKGKEYRADAQIRKLYGITLSDKRVMYINQDYRCKLCRFPIEFKIAHIDHDHKTGRIRGILCSKCNNGLGFFGDNPKRLREAADYLER